MSKAINEAFVKSIKDWAEEMQAKAEELKASKENTAVWAVYEVKANTLRAVLEIAKLKHLV